MKIEEVSERALTEWQKCGLYLISFLVVAFGQPVWSEWLGLIAAVCGFALFWRALLDVASAKERFVIAMGWFSGIQIVQLSWAASHPYYYIYAVLFLYAWLMGAQFGILGIFIKKSTLSKMSAIFALAGLWTLFEWTHLFFLSGMPFNPAGLTLAGSYYPMQLASIAGIFGLSFWVMLTNLLLLRAWITLRSVWMWISVAIAIILPYAYGWGHAARHEKLMESQGTLNVVLVQPAFPIEETMIFHSPEEMRQFVLYEWRQVFAIMAKHIGKKINLIVLPEYLVPFGTFHHVFPVEDVQKLFQTELGVPIHSFPAQESSYTGLYQFNQGTHRLASNAYIAQTLANLFDSHLAIGLEHSVFAEGRKSQAYSSAFHFIPHNEQNPLRYDKQVLVPMGEYIPFDWCKQIAKDYGITGSFECGESAVVFNGPVPFGASICYEEMFGDLISENRRKGAELLINLTNDGWYPNSRLPKQHFDHARIRSIENGIPLVRACNTGVTGAVDSLGRVVALLGENHMEAQSQSDSILVKVPKYHYWTLYSRTGDLPILVISFIGILLGFCRFRKN